MNYEKALSLYKNDKTLQLLRAEHFPLLVSFFHLVFKQQDRISYLQTELQSILGDYLFSLQRQGIEDYQKAPVDYLQKWAEQGYLRRYYERADEPVYELSPATENALKWLEDLNKQQFVGTHSRLIQFFRLLQQIVNTTSGPYERIQQLQEERRKIDQEIEQIRQGNFEQPSDTQLKENYFLAEETAKRLLSDFRQVEENFRELDSQTRQTIIKSNLAKADLLDNVFQQQDFLWNTDQGKSFKAFWEFLMSEQMQEELEELLDKINAIPAIVEIKKEQTVDRIKTNLVDAGDKVNRSNDGLIEQLRKFVEQKNLSESRHILQSIEEMESLLLEHKETLDQQAAWMEIDEVFKPSFTIDRPLFNPPVKVTFAATEIADGVATADTDLLFEQFYVDVEVLRNHVKTLLKSRSQIALSELLNHYKPTKGVAEILGYMQIATNEGKHFVNRDQFEYHIIENKSTGKTYRMQTPIIIFNR
ncbi:hypothetical protein CRN76_11370 [Chryseobacterium indologenes]|uniref:DUF3375 domain-containing protein n=1 Tax=Chryseobacterium indologenes TaxID=253 RepID=UPI000BFE03BE|nr:DUF3375 domain-containing protein [Chryseobacterium indologenes]ATN05958.1 hypothetical protein CRN76_11370 [Chryseobacterium indologenes]AYY85281.1 DUF3375 domain-containing protein [Chryseobacterium indologenes]QIX82180.1 DUF3375 domain-containing protein [Chryseobacterium indologenes]UDQ55967.1 DUF3375 domain-containing protein [Chryseobacterium indologenes]